MLNSIVLVGTQVFILFILISIGFLGGKLKILTQSGVQGLNNVMMYVVTPCVVINAFQREFRMDMLYNLLHVMLAAVIAHVITFLLGTLIIRDKDKVRKKIFRFGVIFSNCGFMGLPLLEGVLGPEGVFYGAGYLAVFYIIVWSYGQYSMAKGTGDFDRKKIILNPGVIPAIVGFVLFACSITLPKLIGTPIAFLSALNTPVPMLIIGYEMTKFSFADFRKFEKWEIITYALRLLASPLVLLGVLYLLGFKGNVLVASVILASTPTAAITSMFSIKYGLDEKLASKMVAVSTLLSILTMTFVVGLAQYLA